MYSSPLKRTLMRHLCIYILHIRDIYIGGIWLVELVDDPSSNPISLSPFLCFPGWSAVLSNKGIKAPPKNYFLGKLFLLPCCVRRRVVCYYSNYLEFLPAASMTLPIKWNGLVSKRVTNWILLFSRASVILSEALQGMGEEIHLTHYCACSPARVCVQQKP